MKNKILITCAKISIALFLGCVCLCVYLWIFNPDLWFFNTSPSSGEPPMHYRHLPLGYDIKLSVSNVEDRKWVIFFNGPYPNYTTTLGPTDTVTGGWDRGYGIYYLVIHDSASKWTWWTLMISLWYPIILFGISPAIFVAKKLRGEKSASTKKTTIEK
jgi:hypothetical protein